MMMMFVEPFPHTMQLINHAKKVAQIIMNISGTCTLEPPGNNQHGHRPQIQKVMNINLNINNN